jgi:hypothetical protein
VPSGRRFIVVELEPGGKGTPIVAEQDQRPKKWANPYLNRDTPTLVKGKAGVRVSLALGGQKAASHHEATRLPTPTYRYLAKPLSDHEAWYDMTMICAASPRA